MRKRILLALATPLLLTFLLIASILTHQIYGARYTERFCDYGGCFEPPFLDLYEANPATPYLSYHVERLPDDRAVLTLRNNSYLPFSVDGYGPRPNATRRKQKQALLRAGLRDELSVNGQVVKRALPGFDCGTGLVQFVVRPYETLSDTLYLGERTRWLQSVRGTIDRRRDGRLYDMLTGEDLPVPIDENVLGPSPAYYEGLSLPPVGFELRLELHYRSFWPPYHRYEVAAPPLALFRSGEPGWAPIR